jgi:hypothetical protein
MTIEDNGMDDVHECSDMPSMAVTFPGPFQHHAVSVNGWEVPLVQAHPQGEDRVLLVLDGRLGAEFSVEEAERVAPFVADAISIALGYACHPRDGMEAPLPLPHIRPRRLTQLAAAVVESAGDDPTA